MRPLPQLVHNIHGMTKGKDQWYINFPMACAQMMDFQKGETVEWELTESGNLLLKRNIVDNEE